MGIFRLRIGTAALGCAAAAAATLGWSSPAAADVTVTPEQAVQGDAGRLTFRVANDSATASLTKVDLQFPASDPVAEVYPLSVPKWAPKITSRPLDRSMPGLHGGRVTDTTSAISWTPAPGSELKPKGTVDLSISLGPLPATERMVFTVVQTYSDGTVNQTTSKPAAVPPVTSQVTVTLLPATAPAGQAAPAAPGGHGHGAAPGANGAAPRANGAVPATGGNAGATGAGTTAAVAGSAGTNWVNVGGWACAAAAGGYALFVLRRGRRQHPTAGDPADDPTRTPAGMTAASTDLPASGTGSPATDTGSPANGGATAGNGDGTPAGGGATADPGGRRPATVGTTNPAGSGKASTGRMTTANASSRGATGGSTTTKDRSKPYRSAAGEPQRQPASAGRWTYRDRR